MTALVSGDREKARKVAAQYGVAESSIYDYKSYDQLAANKDVQAIYIVLPNSMHAEFVLRGAKCRKHIPLCKADGYQRGGLRADDRGLQDGEMLS